MRKKTKHWFSSCYAFFENILSILHNPLNLYAIVYFLNHIIHQKQDYYEKKTIIDVFFKKMIENSVLIAQQPAIILLFGNCIPSSFSLTGNRYNQFSSNWFLWRSSFLFQSYPTLLNSMVISNHSCLFFIKLYILNQV